MPGFIIVKGAGGGQAGGRLCRTEPVVVVVVVVVVVHPCNAASERASERMCMAANTVTVTVTVTVRGCQGCSHLR